MKIVTYDFSLFSTKKQIMKFSVNNNLLKKHKCVYFFLIGFLKVFFEKIVWIYYGDVGGKK